MAAAPEAVLVVPLVPGRDAVRWSDDNILAVACEHTVLILVRSPLRSVSINFTALRFSAPSRPFCSCHASSFATSQPT